MTFNQEDPRHTLGGTRPEGYVDAILTDELKSIRRNRVLESSHRVEDIEVDWCLRTGNDSDDNYDGNGCWYCGCVRRETLRKWHGIRDFK